MGQPRGHIWGQTNARDAQRAGGFARHIVPTSALFDMRECHGREDKKYAWVLFVVQMEYEQLGRAALCSKAKHILGNSGNQEHSKAAVFTNNKEKHFIKYVPTKPRAASAKKLKCAVAIPLAYRKTPANNPKRARTFSAAVSGDGALKSGVNRGVVGQTTPRNLKRARTRFEFAFFSFLRGF